jgi:hypothetical protein
MTWKMVNKSRPLLNYKQVMNKVFSKFTFQTIESSNMATSLGWFTSKPVHLGLPEVHILHG